MAEPKARIDALYGLPFERFVPERDALAKALRADGDKTAADEVRKLSKPTRAAWAVNTAVRENPAAARELADSARLLGDAQRELLAGGDASALREATERAHAAIDELAAAAPASGEAIANKVRETLQAATLDPDVLAEVVSGRLLREQVASGFGGLAAGSAASAGRSRARPRGKPASGERARKDGGDRARARGGRGSAADRERTAPQERAAERERAAAEREATRRRETLRRAKEAEAAAQAEVEGAERALEQIESALAERRTQLREAKARLKDARRRRERAER
jgi:hypothetical protein